MYSQRIVKISNYFILVVVILFSFSVSQAQVIDTSFSPVFQSSGGASVVKVQNDDRIIVAGLFEYASGKASRGLDRLMPDGSMDPSFTFDEDIVGRPQEIEVQDNGKIILRGDFKSVDGPFQADLIRLHSDGSLDTTFNTISIDSIAFGKIKILPNQKILASYGYCDPRREVNCGVAGVRLFDKDGYPDNNFPNILFETDRMSISSSKIADIGSFSDNSIIIMGSNLSYRNINQTAFKLDSIGQVDTSFNASISSNSNFVVASFDILPDGTIGVLEGDLNTVTLLDSAGSEILSEKVEGPYYKIYASDSTYFSLFARNSSQVYKDGSVIDVNNGIGGWSNDSDYQSTGLVSVGTFSTTYGFLIHGILKLKNGRNGYELDYKFNGKLTNTGSVSSVVEQDDGKIIVGGYFNNVNNKTLYNLARLNVDGSLDSTFYDETTDVSTPVYGLELLDDQTLIVASRDANYFGKIFSLSQLNTDGYIVGVLPFNFRGSNSSISYIERDSKNNIYAGENLAYASSGIGGQRFNKYIVESINDYTVEDYNDKFIDDIYRFNGFEVQHDDKLLIYGYEINYDGGEKVSIARANSDGQRDTNFTTDIDTAIHIDDIAILDSSFIFASGYWSDDRHNNLGGVFYKIRMDGKIEEDFSDRFSSDGTSNYQINESHVLPDRNLLVSGGFNQYDDIPISSGSVIIDASGNFIKEFFPEIGPSSIREVVHSDNGVYYVSGSLSTLYGGSGIARILPEAETCASVELKVNLEGAYVQDENIMSTALNDNGYLPGMTPATLLGIMEPAGQPYATAPWYYEGQEGIVQDGSEFVYPDNSVDWVLVDISTSETEGSSVLRKAGILKSDSNIEFLENLEVCNSDTTQAYFVTIKHRNHLPIMNKNGLTISGGLLKYDFTASDTYSSLFSKGQKEVAPGVFAMFSGNVNSTSNEYSESDVNLYDQSFLLRHLGVNIGYFMGDVDMTGDINTQDIGVLARNMGVFTSVR